ncbi:MAG: ATP-grasp domain-containing protein [Desulfotalea sp.]
MTSNAQDVIFTNYSYNKDFYYFLYVGDLKNYSLNYFIQENFERRFNRKVCFVAIIPDICKQYNYANIMVVNPVVKNNDEPQSCSYETIGPRTSCRVSCEDFMDAVSKNKQVLGLVEEILENQNKLYINMHESAVEMTLDEIGNVSILGPNKSVARRYNNKVVQQQELQGIAPFIEGFTCYGIKELLEKTDPLWGKWDGAIFVSASFSAGGAHSGLMTCSADIKAKFTEDTEYTVTRYIEHDHDPTVLGVVANENEVYIAGIADQIIVDGNRFVGSRFPTRSSEEHQDKLKEITVAIGKEMAKGGYRGIFGCDYLIDFKGNIYFLEINARKQGTTLEFCFTLEQNLPEGSPMLPELEYYAVVENRLPPHAVEMKENLRGIYWETYNYKVATKKLTTGYIPQNPYERETFRKVGKKELVQDFVVLEHLGGNCLVMPGTFLARVVSVARNHKDVSEGICQGVGFINQTIIEA